MFARNKECLTSPIDIWSIWYPDSETYMADVMMVNDAWDMQDASAFVHAIGELAMVALDWEDNEYVR